ncbi:MAG TPA: Bax inhibitor-1 family protein [Kofleriaceae bacterium]
MPVPQAPQPQQAAYAPTIAAADFSQLVPGGVPQQQQPQGYPQAAQYPQAVAQAQPWQQQQQPPPQQQPWQQPQQPPQQQQPWQQAQPQPQQPPQQQQPWQQAQPQQQQPWQQAQPQQPWQQQQQQPQQQQPWQQQQPPQQPWQQQPQQQQGGGYAAGAGAVAGMAGYGAVGGIAGKLLKKKMKGGQQPHGGMQGQGDLRADANATVGQSDRVRFIRLTYLHLMLAIFAFAGIEWLLMRQDVLVEHVSIPLVKFALGGRWNWGVVLAAFTVVSWLADYWARHATSRAVQYMGLGFYVIAEALIFVPLLAVVEWKTMDILARGGAEPHIIRDSAFTTLAIFGALTASVVFTKKDFSFMRSGLAMASAGAMMLVILSLVFGFNLGIVFSVAMVLLAAGYILYQTSQVMAHYDPQSYVAASLALFSSVALMFWYVIRIFMRLRD